MEHNQVLHPKENRDMNSDKIILMKLSEPQKDEWSGARKKNPNKTKFNKKKLKTL